MTEDPRYEYELVYSSGSGEATLKEMLANGWEPVPDSKQVDRYVGRLHMVYLWLRRRLP